MILITYFVINNKGIFMNKCKVFTIYTFDLFMKIPWLFMEIYFLIYFKVKTWIIFIFQAW